MIRDLAIMLLTAGVVTVLFKRLNLPLVLGYILAGFLISPYMPWFFTVSDQNSVALWGEIGVIVMMFSLGLEFNLHALAEVGVTGVITALTEVFGMMILGYAAGQALGWDDMESIFLGGMLSMSSTTIIIKAFDEMGIRKEKFAPLVFGTLILEDIAGIFMIIVLSTISQSEQVSAGQLALKLGLLCVYLVVWFLTGIYLVPTLLNRTKEFMNDETMLICSLGLCFGMVLVAERLGFSSALGAFLAGSLLAGTVEAERIERVTAPVKNLFGTIFFLSVGMMIDPSVIAHYFLSILLLSVLTIVGKLFFSGLGVLFAGSSLKNAVFCGCSLTQIGEFAFIIATAGITLGAIEPFIYPIIVSVSVLTTLTTPVMIRNADRIYHALLSILPPGLREKAETEPVRTPQEQDSIWSAFLKQYLKTFLLFGALMAGVVIIALKLVLPFLQGLGLEEWICKGACVAFLILGISLFVVPFLDFSSPQVMAIWLRGKAERIPLLVLSGLKLVFAAAMFFLPMQSVLDISGAWMLLIAAAAVAFAAKGSWFDRRYRSLEAQFLQNVNERNGIEERPDGEAAPGALSDEGLVVTGLVYRGEEQTLMDLQWGRKYGVTIIQLVHRARKVNMPGASQTVRPGDRLHVLGEEEAVDTLVRSEPLEQIPQ